MSSPNIYILVSRGSRFSGLSRCVNSCVWYVQIFLGMPVADEREGSLGSAKLCRRRFSECERSSGCCQHTCVGSPGFVSASVVYWRSFGWKRFLLPTVLHAHA